MRLGSYVDALNPWLPSASRGWEPRESLFQYTMWIKYALGL